MSEAKAEAINARVLCDGPGCGWFEKCDFADVPKWHKRPCPKCGKGEIVSDEEMVVFGLAEAAVKITNYIDPNGKMKRRNYRLNTAPMRTAEAKPGRVEDVVLRHNKLPGKFRVKEFPARDSLPDCALIEKEYSPGVWREYGIVGIDEFSPQNAPAHAEGRSEAEGR